MLQWCSRRKVDSETAAEDPSAILELCALLRVPLQYFLRQMLIVDDRSMMLLLESSRGQKAEAFKKKGNDRLKDDLAGKFWGCGSSISRRKPLQDNTKSTAREALELFTSGRGARHLQSNLWSCRSRFLHDASFDAFSSCESVGFAWSSASGLKESCGCPAKN